MIESVQILNAIMILDFDDQLLLKCLILLLEVYVRTCAIPLCMDAWR